MKLNQAIKVGKTIDELSVGDSLQVTEKIEDKDLLLYLGLTNDANPLYIQHDYALQTEYGRPIVPLVMIFGIISSNISKHLPGPGSHIVDVNLDIKAVIYHYDTLSFNLELIKIDKNSDLVTLSIEAHNQDKVRVLDAVVMVRPPKLIERKEEEEHE